LYDEADRTRNRGTLLFDVTPTDMVDLTFSLAAGSDTYGGPGHEFGLLDSNVQTYNVGINFYPSNVVSFGANYGRDHFDSNQKSRNANPPPDPQFTDPSRDWMLKNTENVNNFNLYADLPKLARKATAGVISRRDLDGIRQPAIQREHGLRPAAVSVLTLRRPPACGSPAHQHVPRRGRESSAVGSMFHFDGIDNMPSGPIHRWSSPRRSAMANRHTHYPVDVADGPLDDVRRWFAAIVDSSLDVIISKNLDGVISTWNSAAERLFGYSVEEAVGQPITIIIPPELHEEEKDILKRLRAGERIEGYETRRITRDGRRLDVSITISPLRDAGGTIIGASKILRDITESKRTQTALRESEKRLANEIAGARTLQAISTRLISESTHESLFAQILDAAIELMSADAGGIQMLTPDGESLTLFGCKNFHAESAVFWQRVTAEASSTSGRALRTGERVLVSDVERCEVMAGTQDLEAYRRSGIRAVQSTPLRSRSGRPLGMISTHWRTPYAPTEHDFRLFDVLVRQAADLIERAQAEEALSTVSQRLIEAQENERAHIARELHDDINQRLSLLSSRLGALAHAIPDTAIQERQQLEEAREDVVGLLKDVQALSHRLHPPRLEYLGLVNASAAMCREISSQHDVEVDFHGDHVPHRLSMRIAVCLYRVLQEALQNAIKHSGTSRVEVSLRGGTDQIELSIHDFGVGFDLNAAEGRGLGLASMRERLKAVRGQLAIRSQPQRGTSIDARVPCSIDEVAAAG